mmetsp:Transcript_8509/g.27069  ORF Transcript_8509/g.27069 Transcript_8509/m.27069 type:complete len:307 (-) Transcript_8509:1294-2214(-)
MAPRHSLPSSASSAASSTACTTRTRWAATSLSTACSSHAIRRGSSRAPLGRRSARRLRLLSTRRSSLPCASCIWPPPSMSRRFAPNSYATASRSATRALAKSLWPCGASSARKSSRAAARRRRCRPSSQPCDILLALFLSSHPFPPPWPSRHFFLHPPRPAFSYRAVRPPFAVTSMAVRLLLGGALDTAASTSTSLSPSPSPSPSVPRFASSVASPLFPRAPPSPSLLGPLAISPLLRVAPPSPPLSSSSSSLSRKPSGPSIPSSIPSAASSQFISSSSVRVVVPSPSSSLSPLSIVALHLTVMGT